jgi:hypothetical protein
MRVREGEGGGKGRAKEEGGRGREGEGLGKGKASEEGKGRRGRRER